MKRINHLPLIRILFPYMLIFFSAVPPLAAQKKYTHRIHIISENDSYNLKYEDGYYTNGLFLKYGWNKKNQKKIQHQLFAGQMIYNAEKGNKSAIDDIDRPVTGYLFAGYRQQRFSSKSLFSWSASLGVMGKEAKGEELQRLVHRTFNMYRNQQWQYQLQSEWSIQTTASWSPFILQQLPKWIALRPTIKASLGNIFTNAGLTSGLLIGKINPDINSAYREYYTATTGQKQYELFFYIEPGYYYQLYNGTIEGGLFNNEQHIFLGKTNPHFTQTRIGMMWGTKHFTLGLATVIENKQSLTQRKRQRYGSISLAYNW